MRSSCTASGSASTRRATRSTRGSAWCTSTSGWWSRSRSRRTSSSATIAARVAASSCVRRPTEQRVEELSERYGLAVNPKAKIWQLSIGEQQRVEILKALYRDARILIMDEPTAVLTPQEAETLFETLRTMADEGKTVIFISHKLHEVKAIADRVTVLRGGRTVATVDAGACYAAVARGSHGRTRDRRRATARAGEAARGRPDARSGRADRSGRSRRDVPSNDVSFAIREGEIVGVAGVAGNGQRELAEALSGMRDIRARERPGRRQAAARRRSARGDPGRRRPRPRGQARNGARSEPQRHEQRRHQDVPNPLAFARAAPRSSTHAGGGRRRSSDATT